MPNNRPQLADLISSPAITCFGDVSETLHDRKIKTVKLIFPSSGSIYYIITTKYMPILMLYLLIRC